MNRRDFIARTAGIAAVAGTGMPNPTSMLAEKSSSTKYKVPTSPGAALGRPVRVVSIGFQTPLPLSEIQTHVDVEGGKAVDIIVLPELCRGQATGTEEMLQGPTVSAMAALAKRHSAYIAVPIDRSDKSRRLNSVVLLDRSGNIATVYNKAYPYWSEYDVSPPVSPGDDICVYHADFGRIGIATCFDINFPEVWQGLADEGADLVIWPSAYSAGRSLQAHAINHHYYIVTSTQCADCIVYDITGERLLYQHSAPINVSGITLDLDRGIYHTNFNLEKRDKLLKEHSEIEQEQWLELEQWFVLRAKRSGVSARALAREYGLEELRPYINRSRAAIDRRRGWEFAQKVVSSEKA